MSSGVHQWGGWETDLPRMSEVGGFNGFGHKLGGLLIYVYVSCMILKTHVISDQRIQGYIYYSLCQAKRNRG